MAETREAMNISEASEHVDVPQDTLYRYASDERAPAFNLGNRWEFKKTVLDTWMEKASRERRGRAAKRRERA